MRFVPIAAAVSASLAIALGFPTAASAETLPCSSGKLCLFLDAGYSGGVLQSSHDFPTVGSFNDRITGVKNRTAFRANLWENINYSGRLMYFNEGQSYSSLAGVSDNLYAWEDWNDRISSANFCGC